MNRISATTGPRAGRPTKEQAAARQALLLDTAIAHFLEKGFEGATVEAIAADVNMTKRTVYARYPDKAALFLAAVNRAITHQAVSDETIRATRAATLDETLTNIAMLRIEAVGSPEGLKLWRIIETESYRFPEIFTTYYEVSALPTVQFLTQILEHETESGRLAIDRPKMAANVFMSMVVGGPVRFITSGLPLGRDDIEERVAFAVRLFLEGAVRR